MTALRTPGIRRPFGFRYANHPPPRTVKSMDKNKSTNQATYKTSEAACQLGVSAEWLRKGEERGFFPTARRDTQSGHRYYTRRDIERLKARRPAGVTRG